YRPYDPQNRSPATATDLNNRSSVPPVPGPLRSGVSWGKVLSCLIQGRGYAFGVLAARRGKKGLSPSAALDVFAQLPDDLGCIQTPFRYQFLGDITGQKGLPFVLGRQQ